MFSPRLASSGTQAEGGVCPLKGGGRVFCPGCPGGGGRERGAGASQNPHHLPWVTRYLLPMLSLHDQGRGLWIFLHVVSGPWTSFVAALDKGQCRKAVCRRHNSTVHNCRLSIPCHFQFRYVSGKAYIFVLVPNPCTITAVLILVIEANLYF